MSISGKMSVGVFLMDATPSNKMSSAITTNVYGRRSAILTIHITPERVGRLGSRGSDAEPRDHRAEFPPAAGRAYRHAPRPNREEPDVGTTIIPMLLLLL